jgi:hypothetical protein
MALPKGAFGQSTTVRQADFLPQEIRDIDMGASSAWLRDRIKNSGTHTDAPLARPNRIKITWAPNGNPYYSQLEFFFTEKDRLYLMRFALNEESRWNINALKKQFLDKFHVSSEEPRKFRIGDKDMISYAPGSGGTNHLFEVSEVGTGKKFLEIFERTIDRVDRPPAKPATQEEAQQKGKTGEEPGK